MDRTGDGGRHLEEPEWLETEREERAYWEKLVGALRSLEVLDSTDGLLIELAARTYGEYMFARAELVTEGSVLETTSGRGHEIRKANPAGAVMGQAAGRLRQLLSDLGLGPVMRAKLKGAAGAGGDDPVGDLLA